MLCSLRSHYEWPVFILYGYVKLLQFEFKQSSKLLSTRYVQPSGTLVESSYGVFLALTIYG